MGQGPQEGSSVSRKLRETAETRVCGDEVRPARSVGPGFALAGESRGCPQLRGK